jgi:hypothetical protein
MSRRISFRSIFFETPIIEKMTVGSSAFAILLLKRGTGRQQARGFGPRRAHAFARVLGPWMRLSRDNAHSPDALRRAFQGWKSPTIEFNSAYPSS